MNIPHGPLFSSMVYRKPLYLLYIVRSKTGIDCLKSILNRQGQSSFLKPDNYQQLWNVTFVTLTQN
jgi:hypothetical protein